MYLRDRTLSVKVDTGRLGAALGFYTTRKPIAAVDVASGRFAVVDHQKNRGAELSVFGEPVRGLRVLGGATWLDTDVTGKEAIGSIRRWSRCSPRRSPTTIASGS